MKKIRKFLYLLTVIMLCFPVGLLEVSALDTKEDTQALLKQYNALENDELREQVFIELYIDYVDSLDRFLQTFQADPNNPELDTQNEEFLFNFAHFSNVLEAVYDKDKLSEPIKLVLPLIELHGKLGGVATLTEKLVQNRENTDYISPVLKAVNQLLPFLKTVAAELDAGGYVETINNQASFSQNYGAIQAVEEALAQEKKDPSVEPETPVAPPIEGEKNEEDTYQVVFDISEESIKQLQDIVWSTKTHFDALVNEFATATSAKDVKSTGKAVGALTQSAKQLQAQQAALNTWLQSQVNSEQIKTSYNPYLQLVDQLTQFSFQVSEVSKAMMSRYKLLHDGKEEHVALLNQITTFVQEAQGLLPILTILTGEEQDKWAEKFKANTEEVGKQFLDAFLPAVQKGITDGQELVKSLGKLKNSKADKEQLKKDIKKKQDEAKKKAKDAAEKLKKEREKQKISKAQKEKADKELQSQVTEIQSGFKEVATSFVQEGEAETKESFESRSSLVMIQTAALNQKITKFKKLAVDQQGRTLDTEEYEGCLNWCGYFETITIEIRDLSTNLQKNFGTIQANPAFAKRIEDLTEQTKKFSQTAALSKEELKVSGFFGLPFPQEEYKNAGIKDFFKKIGNGITSAAKAIAKPFVQLVENFSDVKCTQGIDARNKNVSGANYMSAIPDETPIYQQSIVSTHDSISYLPRDGFKAENIIDKDRAQIATLKKQLELGVRAFDIRLEMQNGKLRLIHGSTTYKGTLENEVLDVYVNFLKEHPTEVIFGGIPEIANGTVKNYIASHPEFKKYFDYPGGDNSKTMREVRGKISLGNVPGPYATAPNRPFNDNNSDWLGPTLKDKKKDIDVCLPFANSLNNKQIGSCSLAATAGLQSGKKVFEMLSGQQRLTPEGYADQLNPYLRNRIGENKNWKKVGRLHCDMVGYDKKGNGKELNPAVVWQVNFR